MGEIILKLDLKNLALETKQRRITQTLESLHEETALDAGDLPQDVQKILGCIHDHLFESTLTVGTVKSSCQIRDNNASTRFRLATGLGIREYIEACRLDLAQRFLRENAVEIYLVAMAVGYECQETFCRAFHRRYGYTASSCRLDPPRVQDLGQIIKRKRQEERSNEQDRTSLTLAQTQKTEGKGGDRNEEVRDP